ncbi:MAG: hypothetical protein A2Z42_00555 [Candidatus Woykebacteria bacterium RBG_19FT_COMBO_43_10]|uniref:Uncharacterized protein n=1 Tax=Candidatus Woykebacteria bacterium RBG_19FT_COMBO_43_10 TaxID=1802598 RepID=A0A1G1WL72_9BACT|nr:MAG: hypothetical protein A2Z42_00555 [Candidatus Woykebacteria bacterium RBG_19FT_COMBO_43_10]
MDYIYLLDYLLFTFFASFGVIQIASAKKYSGKTIFGVVLLIASYVWFFASRDRNVPTIVEGAQLFFVFSASSVMSLILTKIILLASRNKK